MPLGITSMLELEISEKHHCRVFNVDWNDLFSLSDAESLPPGISDHSPILVSLNQQQGLKSLVLLHLL